MEDIDQPIPTDLIAESVQWVNQYAEHLTEYQVSVLERVVAQQGPRHSAADAPYEAIDINSEILLLMRALTGLRREVMSDDGRVLQGMNVRDAREVVTSITSLLSLLMKSKEKLDHMDRLRAIEEATVLAVKELDSGAQDRFFTLLEERLGVAAPA